MKINKVIIGLLIGVIFLTSCEKEEETSNGSSTNNGGTNTSVNFDEYLKITIDGNEYLLEGNSTNTPEVRDFNNELIQGGYYYRYLNPLINIFSPPNYDDYPFDFFNTTVSFDFRADSSELADLEITSYPIYNQNDNNEAGAGIVNPNLSGCAIFEYVTYPSGKSYVPITDLTGHKILSIDYIGKEYNSVRQYNFSVFEIEGKFSCKLKEDTGPNGTVIEYKDVEVEYKLQVLARNQ